MATFTYKLLLFPPPTHIFPIYAQLYFTNGYSVSLCANTIKLPRERQNRNTEWEFKKIFKEKSGQFYREQHERTQFTWLRKTGNSGRMKNRETDNKRCLLNPPLPLEISVIKWAKFKPTPLPLFQINTQINVLKKEKLKIAMKVNQRE